MPPTEPTKTDKDEIKATEENSSKRDKPNIFKANWRSKGLKKRQQHALKEGYLTDVTFTVGPEKTLFQAHKLILSLASPVFEAMFYGSLREACDQIEITDIVPIGFKLLLDYIYSDDLKLNNESEAFTAWIAADKYCLPDVEHLCLKYLSQFKLTNANVWTVLEHSLFFESKSLVCRCCCYLKTNIYHAIQSPTFLDISSETLKTIILLPSLLLYGHILLRGIVLWAQERIKITSEGTLSKLLEPFIPFISFGSMNQHNFLNFIDEYPDVLSDSDTLKILKHIISYKRYSLPEWCDDSVNSRKAIEKQILKLVTRTTDKMHAHSNIMLRNKKANCSSDLQNRSGNGFSDCDSSSENCSSQCLDSKLISGEVPEEDGFLSSGSEEDDSSSSEEDSSSSSGTEEDCSLSSSSSELRVGRTFLSRNSNGKFQYLPSWKKPSFLQAGKTGKNCI